MQLLKTGFVSTGSMAQDREGATATRLYDGRVLIAGGSRFVNEGTWWSEHQLASAEVYDPATGKFTATGSLTVPRSHATATLLFTGKVLIAGGYNGEAAGALGPQAVETAELYDPATGKFTRTGSMTAARDRHTATILPGGRVLIAGGESDVAVASAEVYDPATGKFTATGAMAVPRTIHTATVLQSGWVLVTGGANGDQVTAVDSTEGYTMDDGHWTDLGSMTTARAGHTATPLGSLKNVGEAVLICGGMDAREAFLATCERLEMAPGSFTPVGKMTAARFDGAAVLLRDGRVLILGGTVDKDDHATATADLYSATTGLSKAGSMHTARAGATATVMRDGSVLIVGGYNTNTTLSSAELFWP